MDRWGDAAIAIDRDVAARFPLALPLTIVHNSVKVAKSSARGEEARRELGLPEGRVLIGFVVC